MFLCVRGLLYCDLTRLGPLGVSAVSSVSTLCTRGSPALIVFSERLGEMSKGEYWLGLTDMLVAVIGNWNKIAVPDHFCPNSFKVKKICFGSWYKSAILCRHLEAYWCTTTRGRGRDNFVHQTNCLNNEG